LFALPQIGIAALDALTALSTPSSPPQHRVPVRPLGTVDVAAAFGAPPPPVAGVLQIFVTAKGPQLDQQQQPPPPPSQQQQQHPSSLSSLSGQCRAWCERFGAPGAAELFEFVSGRPNCHDAAARAAKRLLKHCGAGDDRNANANDGVDGRHGDGWWWWRRRCVGDADDNGADPLARPVLSRRIFRGCPPASLYRPPRSCPAAADSPLPSSHGRTTADTATSDAENPQSSANGDDGGGDDDDGGDDDSDDDDAAVSDHDTGDRDASDNSSASDDGGGGGRRRRGGGGASKKDVCVACVTCAAAPLADAVVHAVDEVVRELQTRQASAAAAAAAAVAAATRAGKEVDKQKKKQNTKKAEIGNNNPNNRNKNKNNKDHRAQTREGKDKRTNKVPRQHAPLQRHQPRLKCFFHLESFEL
jgi:hypothetical protein